jgi:hypothetical protein
MSHLAEVYAKDLGVKIGEPILNPHFYPIVDENYITIHNDDKVESKKYDYWEEVIILVKKSYPEIKFIQIGSGKESKIKNVDKFTPTNNVKQSAYIIKNSIMHVGIDSLPVHIASTLDKPIVAVYAHTLAKTCEPLWGNKENHFLIESHRNGNKPSYSLKENPKTINLIKPEEISNKILSFLGKEESNRDTLYIGSKYKESSLHVFPDHRYDLSSKILYLRLDLHFNENNAEFLTQKNKVAIITDKPFRESILRYKNVQKVIYFSKKFDKGFIDLVKSKGIDITLYCTSKQKIKEERFKYFDNQIILFDKNKVIKENKKKINIPEVDFKLKSYRIYLKDKKANSSLYEANGCENLQDIFVDLDHLMIYTDLNE